MRERSERSTCSKVVAAGLFLSPFAAFGIGFAMGISPIGLAGGTAAVAWPALQSYCTPINKPHKEITAQFSAGLLSVVATQPLPSSDTNFLATGICFLAGAGPVADFAGWAGRKLAQATGYRRVFPAETLPPIGDTLHVLVAMNPRAALAPPEAPINDDYVPIGQGNPHALVNPAAGVGRA